MPDDKQRISQLNIFKTESKFGEENMPYPALSKPELKDTFSNLMNQSADDFITAINNGSGDDNFRLQIQKGLERFDAFEDDLDTEDKELICSYYERLMDIVELESSGGLLNTWLYGFDPNSAG